MSDSQDPAPPSISTRRLPDWLRVPLAVLLLCALSLGVLRAPPRFAALPEQPAFAAMSELTGWQRTRDASQLQVGPVTTLRLEARPGRLVYGFRWISPLAPNQAVRVSAEMRGEGLVDGHIGGGAAQLVALSLDTNHNRIPHWPYRVGALDGDGDWRPVRLVIPAAEHIRGLQVIAFVAARGGSMELRNPRVEAVRERGVFTLARYLLLAAWFASWAGAAWWLTRRGPRRLSRALLALSATLALVAGLAPPPELTSFVKTVLIGGQDAWYELAAVLPQEHGKPGGTADDTRTRSAQAPDAGTPDAPPAPSADGQPPDSLAVGTPAQTQTPAAPPRQYWMPPQENLDKRGHMAGFAMLALVAAFAFRSRPAWRVLPGVAMLAFSIESLQGFTAMREPDPLDLAADLAGGVAGVLLAWLAARGWRMLRPGERTLP